MTKTAYMFLLVAAVVLGCAKPQPEYDLPEAQSGLPERISWALKDALKV